MARAARISHPRLRLRGLRSRTPFGVPCGSGVILPAGGHRKMPNRGKGHNARNGRGGGRRSRSLFRIRQIPLLEPGKSLHHALRAPGSRGGIPGNEPGRSLGQRRVNRRLTMRMRKRRPRPDAAAKAAMGEVESRGWYSRIPPPETTWPECATCGTRARILDEEHRECIRCRIARARKAHGGSISPEPTDNREGPF